MVIKSVVLWFGLLAMAIAWGAAREGLIRPRIGDESARRIASVVLAGIVFGYTWLTIGWLEISEAKGYWLLGLMWVVMTVMFEFGFGRLVGKLSWSEILADYNVLAGRLWVLVLISTGCSPWLAGWLRGTIS